MSYPGQGNPIPESIGHGVWLYENVVWLSISDPRVVPPPPEGLESNETVVAPNGNPTIEFGAARIAATMKITVDELLAANSRGEVTIANWRVPARPGDVEAMRFRVSYGDRHFEISQGHSPKPGSAFKRP